MKLLLGRPDIEVNSESNGGVTSLLVALKNSRVRINYRTVHSESRLYSLAKKVRKWFPSSFE